MQCVCGSVRACVCVCLCVLVWLKRYCSLSGERESVTVGGKDSRKRKMQCAGFILLCVCVCVCLSVCVRYAPL